jgi:predicted lipoprotein with Yx(FWY)xxD motif
VKRRATLVPLACAAAAVGLLTLSACAGTAKTASAGGQVSSRYGGRASPATRSSAPAGAVTPPAHALTLKVAQTALGAVVVGPDGRTLYRFDKDSAAPPASTCTGGCLSAWQPLLGKAASVVATGIDGSLVGTVTRPDGSTQLTLHGWPLYHYSGDSKPGDVNGDGVAHAWHAIAPNGQPAAGASGGGYGGYGG